MARARLGLEIEKDCVGFSLVFLGVFREFYELLLDFLEYENERDVLCYNIPEKLRKMENGVV